MFKKNSRFRRLLMIALIAVPWFFRDQFATTLDEHTRDVQQVLIEKSNHEERQQQDSDQREMRHLLAGIELNQRANNGEVSEEKIAEEAADNWSRTAKEEGKALERDVNTFDSLRKRVTVDDDAKRAMDEVSMRARDIAETLKGVEYNAAATAEDDKKIDALLTGFSKVDEDLQAQWAKLKEAAENEEASSSSTATASRFIAWLCTAIGALMVGDWKGLLGGFSGDNGESS